MHGGSAKTGSRCTSPLQRAYHRFPATACRFRCRCSTNSRLESPDAPIASRYRPSSSSRRNEIGSWERRRMYDGYIRLARRLKHRGRQEAVIVIAAGVTQITGNRRNYSALARKVPCTRKVTRIDSRNTWRETRRKEMADRVILMVYRGRGGDMYLGFRLFRHEFCTLHFQKFQEVVFKKYKIRRNSGNIVVLLNYR